MTSAGAIFPEHRSWNRSIVLIQGIEDLQIARGFYVSTFLRPTINYSRKSRTQQPVITHGSTGCPQCPVGQLSPLNDSDVCLFDSRSRAGAKVRGVAQFIWWRRVCLVRLGFQLCARQSLADLERKRLATSFLPVGHRQDEL